MEQTSRPALVLDGDLPQTLAIVRSLGRKGVSVTVGATSSSALSLRSRYCVAALYHPDPIVDGEGFVLAVRKWIKNHGGAIIIPVSDRTLIPLLERLGDLPDALIASPPNDALDRVRSKQKTMELAQEIGVPTPYSTQVTNLEDLPKEVSVPLVLKPERSFVADQQGRLRAFTVDYAQSRREAIEKLSAMIPFTTVLVQELVKGEGVGIGLLAIEGEAISAFQWRRLHEVPLTGGGSSYRISEPLHPEMLKCATRLIRALDWHGVAMVEFKHDETSNRFWLMEINGRFWGSLPLAIASGVDFPWQLYQLYSGQKPSDIGQYQYSIRSRLLSKDLEWIQLALEGGKQEQGITKKRILSDTLRMLHRKDKFDVQQWDDLRPALYDLSQIIARYYRSLPRFFNRLFLPAKVYLQRRGISPLHRYLRNADEIVFVCSGNIIRSAYAEAKLRSLLDPSRNIKISSCGVWAIGGSPANAVALKLAKKRGVDLSLHRAETFSGKKISQSAIIFAMEPLHLNKIAASFPAQYKRCFLLRAVSQGPIAIPDPVSEKNDVFELVFDSIDESLKALASRI